MKGFRALFLTALCGALLGCRKHPPAEVAPPTAVGARTQGVDARDSGAPPPRVLDERQRFHVLSRLTFGPTVESMRHLEQLGLEAWLDEQVAPAQAPSAELEEALAPYRAAIGTPEEILPAYQYSTPSQPMEVAHVSGFRHVARDANARRVLQHFQMVELSRHILAHHQLREVLVDFWTNHFSIGAQKRYVQFLAPSYVEHAIRPHALGRFKDILSATAHHPAMLEYLDNARSMRPTSKNPAGLNENYARELLELHTLGVRAGYSQSDVRAAAHILTGWSVQSANEGAFEFMFRKAWHAPEPQKILGTTFDAEGIQQGEDMLAWLASHPATARNVSTKLCMRFVADVPPEECIAAAVAAFSTNDGDISTVMRAIVYSKSFWHPEHTGQLVKTPLDFAMSAARLLGAKPDGTVSLAQHLGALGEPILMNPIPTGYPTSAAVWASADGMMQRYRFATRLAAGKAGLFFTASEVLPDVSSKEALRQSFNDRLPSWDSIPGGMDVFIAPLLEVSEPQVRREMAISMMLSSAEFQEK